MLALTHHLIVQAVYREVYPTSPVDWYDNYEVLGDDIVLFDETVAKTYLQFMEMIGVGINLSKSVISNNGSFEFAKVTSYKGHTVSAVSWRMFMSQRTRMGRVNILHHLLSTLDIKHPVRYIQNMVMFRPGMLGDYGFSVVALLTMLSTSSKDFSFAELLRTLGSVTVASSNYIKKILERQNTSYLEYLVSSLIKGEALTLTSRPLVDMQFAMDHPFQKIAVADDLRNFKKSTTQFKARDDLTFAIIANLLPRMDERAKVLKFPYVPDPREMKLV
jgi:hypothetical protein